MIVRHLSMVLSVILLSACTTTPPKITDDLCEIYQEKDDWYDNARQAEVRWGTPIAVQMAIMRQESRFVADAQPPRPWLLGVIPWFRTSSAYGYPQAKDETWAEYQRYADNQWGDREDFADSCDFIAWYCATSHNKLGIPLFDTHNLYLAYHEGLGGYRRRSYQNKPWLLKTAQKVDQQARRYQAQLSRCQPQLNREN